MHITAIALIIAIIGLLSSTLLVGGLISLVSFIMGIIALRQEKTIDAVRVIAISVAGLLVPFIMYFNTYGVSLPVRNGSGKSAYREIIATNFTNMGIAFAGDKGKSGIASNDMGMEMAAADNMTTASDELNEAIARAGQNGADNGAEENDTFDESVVTGEETGDGEEAGESEPQEDEMVYISLTDSVKRGVIEHAAELDPKDIPGKKSEEAKTEQEKDAADAGISVDKDDIFESLDSIGEDEKNKGGIISIAPKDDDMPSYGGLPVGTLIIAQYYREDDHNCNPVLVLQNKTGETVRYECKFIARNAYGNELAVSQKTVEVVRNGSLFVFEGRFDKKELGGQKPSVYEFLITKRTPYENDMASEVSLYTKTEGASAIVTAVNNSDSKAKVDAYVLFFDGTELVDCMWMIPQNTDEVCLYPGTSASIQGDAYYRFDRVETYYTAYEAIEGQ